MTKFAFEINTLVMVQADSEDEAWEQVQDVARNAVNDFEFQRSPEDDCEETYWS